MLSLRLAFLLICLIIPWSRTSGSRTLVLASKSLTQTEYEKFWFSAMHAKDSATLQTSSTTYRENPIQVLQNLLLFAYCGRELTTPSVPIDSVEYHEANRALEDRKKKVEDAFRPLEQDMKLLGCTGTDRARLWVVDCMFLLKHYCTH